jgi:hypothetical protein
MKATVLMVMIDPAATLIARHLGYAAENVPVVKPPSAMEVDNGTPDDQCLQELTAAQQKSGNLLALFVPGNEPVHIREGITEVYSGGSVYPLSDFLRFYGCIINTPTTAPATEGSTSPGSDTSTATCDADQAGGLSVGAGELVQAQS